MKTARKTKNFHQIKIENKTFLRLQSEIDRLLTVKTDHKSLFIQTGSAGIIPLISPAGSIKNKGPFSSGASYCPTKYLKNCPTLFEFLMSLPGKKFSCRISVMRDNTEMYPHRDHFRNFPFGVVRLHLPIYTNQDSFFVVEGQKFQLKSGHLYYLDIAKAHYVINDSQKPRVHLIIDIEATETLLKLLKIPMSFKNLPFAKLISKTNGEAIYPCEFKPKREMVPFPLADERSSWHIRRIKTRWWLRSKTFSYEISEAAPYLYYLKEVGPGFQFFFIGSHIQIVCHGAQIITKNGVDLRSLTQRIKLKLQPDMHRFQYARSKRYLEIATRKYLILNPVMKENAENIVLTGLPQTLWNTLALPMKIKMLQKKLPTQTDVQIRKALRAMVKKGIIEQSFAS